jgi:hypothetical protein
MISRKIYLLTKKVCHVIYCFWSEEIFVNSICMHNLYVSANILHVQCLELFVCGLRSRDSVVGTATGYGLYDRGGGVRVPAKSRIFSLSYRQERLWGPHILLSNGYRVRGLSPGVTRLKPEDDHLQLVTRSRRRGSTHPLHYTSSWHST